jgi:glutamine synthetase adenylyltransferase
MPTTQLGSAPSREKLLHELNAHLEAVQEIYHRVIHAQRPSYYNLAPPAPAEVERPETGENAASDLVRFLTDRAPALATRVSRAGLRRGAGAFEHFLEKVVPNAEWMRLLDSNDRVARYTLDIFEHSPYFAEELIRSPELMEELSRLSPARDVPFAEVARHLDDVSDLRRLFRREMFQIQAASMCLRLPVFETLETTSDLADAAIAASYRMALEQVAASHPPAASGYQPA